MPPVIIDYITNYGYLAIFILVFMQEIGIPNPVPNELLLLFCGYLAFKGILFLPFVMLTTISADFMGANTLYIVFYFFGTYILKHKPRWLPVSDKKINRLSERMSNGGLWSLYIGRLTPLVRGYTSVIAGLLRIKPVVYLPVALVSAIIYSTVYVITGRVVGPYWSDAVTKIGTIKFIILSIVLILFIIIGIRYFRNSKKKIREASNVINPLGGRSPF